jgi:hypothetical protein
VVRIVLFIAARRARNRVLDAVGWLLGYCMATTWRPETDERGPGFAGYAHWRCWHTRRQHRNMHGPNYWHRFGPYRWRPAGPTEHAPLRTASGEVSGYGSPPWWARRWPHALTPSRRQERLVMEYAERQSASRRAQRAAAERARESRIVAVFGAVCPHGVQFLNECQKCPGGWRAALHQPAFDGPDDQREDNQR